MSLKNFVVKNGLTVGLANIDATTGNLISGNANLGNLATANYFSGNGSLLSSITGANVTGQVANALVSGTVYTNAQPNITSVGTLTGLNVNGVSNLGGNGNVIITGGSSGQFLQTNGSGNLSWQTIVTSGVTNGTSNVSIPVANGNINMSVNGNANVAVVTGTGVNVAGTLNATGNANVGNLGATGIIATTLGGTLTTAAQPNVTSVGTLTSLDVTGNVTAGNVYSNSGTIGASVLTGTLSTAAQPNITSVGTLSSLAVTGNASAGNINAGNLLTANYVTGTLTTNAQPNITGVGTLSSLDVTGNITTGANIVTDLIVGKTTSVTITATGADSNIFLKPTGNGTVDVWSKIISNVATPLASTDAATKQYVDDIAQGLHVHAPCDAATPNTLAVISGGTVTYNNGTAGVGATLTTTGTYSTIDGVNIATVGTRILVKNETNTAYNGIYVYTSGTVLTRASDYDTPTEMAGGDFTFVQQGTLYNDTGWVMTDPVTTVGTSPVVFLQFSGAGTYTAGTGLTLNGTQFSISNTAVTAGTYGNGDAVASFQVNAQGQLISASNVNITANAANLTGTTLSSTILNSSLTSVGTLTTLSVSGDATAGNVYANSGTVKATNLTGTLTTAAQPNVTSVGTLSSLDVTGTTTSGNIYANSGTIGASLLTGTLTTNAQPNVTSVGTLSSLSVTGTTTSGNVYANSGTIGASLLTGTLTTAAQPNITSVGSLSSLTVTGNIGAGNVDAGNLVKANYVQGTLTTAAQPNITSVGTLSSLDVSANILAGNVYANSGTIGANVVNGNLVGGTLTTAAQPNVTSVGTLSSLLSSGNITGANVIANTGGAFYGNAAGLTNIPSGNISGQVANALVAGTVYTNAQPNITSVGTLTSLSVSGNVDANNFTGANLVSANYVAGTLTTAAQPNITSVGTLTSLATSGNITVGGNVKVQVGITSNRANVSVTSSPTVIDQFAPSDFRTAKYVISASGADGYQSVEALLVHDGVDAYVTIYGSICSNVSADIIELSANINGVSGNVAVYAVSNSASCVVNLVSSYIKT